MSHNFFNLYQNVFYLSHLNFFNIHTMLGFLGALGAVLGLGNLVSGLDANDKNVAAVKDTNATNYKIAQEANALNEKMFNQQLNQQQNQFQQQMDYNSIRTQVQQLKDVGLNPALSYGGGQSVGAGSVPSAPTAHAAVMDAPQYSDVFGSTMQNVMAVISGLSESSKSSAEARGINIDNQTRDAVHRAELEKADALVKQLLSSKDLSVEQRNVLIETGKKIKSETDFLNMSQNDSIENLRLQNANLFQQTKVLQEQANNFAADTAYKKVMTALSGVELRFKPSQLKAAISEAYSRISLMASQEKLTNEQVDVEVQKYFTELEKTYGLKLDNKEKRSIMPYIIDNAQNVARMSTINSYNPAYYAGQILGGAGAALIRQAGK